MFRWIGELVSRFPGAILLACGLCTSVLLISTPDSTGLWQEGEFAFLPENAPSSRAQSLFRQAFPPSEGKRFGGDESGGTAVQRDPLGSSLVIVLYRENRPEGLAAQDRQFLSEKLLPKLEEIRRSSPKGYHDDRSTYEEIPDDERVIIGISTPDDKRLGFLLISPDQRAALVVLQLQTEFLDRQNGLVIERLEKLLSSTELLQHKPVGLALALSGSATVGRDILQAELQSAQRTEMITVLLLVILLLLIYRSPVLALIPLITVGLSVKFTNSLLIHLADREWIGLFNGLRVYVTVVVYGAGVDYCLFLIARYREELNDGASFPKAIVNSISRIGAPLATSAGTSIVGIGMMMLADFGKFRQAGLAIALGLCVALCFALLITPAILVFLRAWAFWPDLRQEAPPSQAGWLPAASLWKRLHELTWMDDFWRRVARALEARPGRLFGTTVLIMLPLALVGLWKQHDLSYGLLSDLPSEVTSVVGAEAIQSHFPAGVTGPVTVLVRFDHAALKNAFDGDDLTDQPTSKSLCEQMTLSIEQRIDDLKSYEFEVVDIRNQIYPLGKSERALHYLNTIFNSNDIVQKNATYVFARRTYNSHRGELAGQVMRMDFVFRTDPFERISIARLANVEQAIRDSIPEPLQETAQVLSLGPTSGIRDLKTTTDKDRQMIALYVTLTVYLLLVAMLRQPAICGFLIVSVVFSYFVSLGLTSIVFWIRDPSGFHGLDWKVPIYLFTILVAMGEDYNILLMARVREEQRKLGPIAGISAALTKTGGIISSCGIIMAGTFASLMGGSLLGMIQLGFALSIGMLLDTFVVRPILVPAYLILLNRGDFGTLSKYLGAQPIPTPSDPSTPSSTKESEEHNPSPQEAS